MARAQVRVSAVVLLGLVVASCGGADEPATPTPAELAASLLVVDDLGGDWSVPSDIEFPSRVLTEAMEGNLPVIDLCPDAGTEAIAAAAGLRWQAGMGFILGGSTEGFAPNLIELLFAGETSEIEATFDLLKAGASACLDVESFVEDAGTLVSLDFPIPAVGDDRFGVWTRQIDQPEGSPRWDLRQVFVRRGAVILWIQEVEINPTSETVVTQQQIDAIVGIAVDKLPQSNTWPGCGGPRRTR